ncbi:MAG: hypothetical protein JW763_00405 [candidate division Zixibacteria bacterium]|nr:hypothetical protein [candidate division Zixibacteria bacterium]
MEAKKTEKPLVGSGIYHPSARPMQVLRDDDGCLWLCDKDIDPNKAFAEQNCWRCRDLQFTRND